MPIYNSTLQTFVCSVSSIYRDSKKNVKKSLFLHCIDINASRVKRSMCILYKVVNSNFPYASKVLTF